MADIGGSSRVNTSKADEEIVVGFDNEIMMIKEQLTGGKKQQEVVSIIGMAGLGKTTLPRKVYDDPFIEYHFYIRAWSYVSQDYRKRDLLLGILSYVIELTDEMHEMSDEELSLKLKKGLMGRRYLIVMDDIWSVDASDCLKRSFPDDNNGSRIMFTSQLKDVALHAKPDSHLHCLRFLTEDESWFLFQQKAFGKETCPLWLMGIGMEITKKCLGLPLAIVVTARSSCQNRKEFSIVGESCKKWINVIEYPCFGDPAISDDSPSLMADLQTISQVVMVKHIGRATMS
ncbi:hypothetical protein F0562_034353 [Nyssa sinensis]|uniref:NB-ARC domain-containing protein n=1 Tax=Nyssa sinensis TaxID=561372 RepID=A0A5J5AHX9_9ASTE|nr:hypothetical protein F0562_034353 [Nyssa sinensis]